MTPDRNAGLGQLRRDLRGLIALELVQRATAVGALVTIAVYAVVVSADTKIAVSLVLGVLLALSSLALAFRIRSGQEHLRHHLRVLELREWAAAESLGSEERFHPYRDSARGGARRP